MSVINRGQVDWSGENPGIYLKDPGHPDGPWVGLAVYFKVIHSAHGRGRRLVELGTVRVDVAEQELLRLRQPAS